MVASANDLATNRPANDLATNRPANDLATNRPANDLATNRPANDLATNRPANDLATNRPANDPFQRKRGFLALNRSPSGTPFFFFFWTVCGLATTTLTNDVATITPYNDSPGEQSP
jgi:hypothetical protein